MSNKQPKYSTMSGSLVGGIPMSDFSNDIRFKNLVIPTGLYTELPKIHNTLSNITETIKTSTINNDIFDQLLNSVSSSRIHSNKNTRKKR
jgi:hypothetical protein